MRRTSAILLLLLGLLCMVCVLGQLWLVEFVLLIGGGWMIYLARTVPQIQVNWGEIVIAATALGLFTAGVHYGLRSWAKWAYERDYYSRSNWRLRYSLAVVSLVMLMFIAGTAMIGIVHQTTWLLTMEEPRLEGRNREAARRNSSLSNLKQLGITIDNYESLNHRYPQGCTTNGQGELLHSWTTQLLPYIEERPMYDEIDHDQAWDSEANAEVFRRQIHALRSPELYESEDERGFALTHYSANVLALGGDRKRTATDFPDGAASTIFFGEANGNYKAWGNPTNWRDPALGLGQSPDGFGGPWSDGETIVAFGDGHAMRLNKDIDPKVFRALCTPSGGEQIDIARLNEE